MTRFIARRLLLSVPVFAGVATLVFSLIHLVPGDPVQAMLGESASPEDIADLRDRLGLDRPLLRAVRRLPARRMAPAISARRCARNQPVTAAIAERMPATFELALAAMLVAMLVAIPLGIIAAVRAGTARRSRARRRWRCSASRCPNFWLGPLLAIVFAVDARLAAGLGPRHRRAPRAAGDHARRAAGRGPGADDARQRHRRTARAVRARGARARRLAHARRAAPRVSQQPDPDRHGRSACSSARC